MSIGQRILQKRKELTLSRNELCELANIPNGQLWHYENDNRTPNAENIIVLAKALGVTADWLLGIEGEIQPVEPDTLADIEKKLLWLFRNRSPEAQQMLIEFAESVSKYDNKTRVPEK